MTNEEALAKINGRLTFGMKPGLRRISQLLEELGDPQKKLKFVHVAGTNGKGTTCALTASVLRQSGYTVGLYTSPYVEDFRERFQINGEMIPPEELAQEVELLSPIAEAHDAVGDTVTEFEFITALAFHWFARRKCDIVVLEVGLGGRFDATNAIDAPEVAVIASISLDHTAILGDTLDKIAFEKAGIVKPGGRLVLYPWQAGDIVDQLRGICVERGAELTLPDTRYQVLEESLAGTVFQAGEETLRTPFLGEHQVRNAITARTALEVLRRRGWHIPDGAIREGFAKAFLPARMEVLSTAPLCLLDGGHNPGCAGALRDALERFVPQRKVGIMGVMADKDSHEALRLLAPLFAEIVTIAPDNPRALPAEQLAQTAAEFCPRVRPAQTCGEAIARAMKAMGPGDALVVCGSFYLAGEIREPLKGKLANLQASDRLPQKM